MPKVAQAELWREFLPESVREGTIAEVFRRLKENFGEPETRQISAEATEVTFKLPDRLLHIFQSTPSQSILGVTSIFLQTAPIAAPCPTPGFAGTSTGLGTANISLNPLKFLFLTENITGAIALATIEATKNLNAIIKMLCPAVCPPPCRCVTTPAVPPAPKVDVLWQKVLGVPVGVTISVEVGVSANKTCV